jgi:hypothetical protein
MFNSGQSRDCEGCCALECDAVQSAKEPCASTFSADRTLKTPISGSMITLLKPYQNTRHYIAQDNNALKSKYYSVSALLHVICLSIPCNSVLEKPLVARSLVEFSTFYATQRLITVFVRSPLPVPVLSQVGPVLTPASCFRKIVFSIILSSYV